VFGGRIETEACVRQGQETGRSRLRSLEFYRRRGRPENSRDWDPAHSSKDEGAEGDRGENSFDERRLLVEDWTVPNKKRSQREEVLLLGDFDQLARKTVPRYAKGSLVGSFRGRMVTEKTGPHFAEKKRNQKHRMKGPVIVSVLYDGRSPRRRMGRQSLRKSS